MVFFKNGTKHESLLESYQLVTEQFRANIEIICRDFYEPMIANEKKYFRH